MPQQQQQEGSDTNTTNNSSYTGETIVYDPFAKNEIFFLARLILCDALRFGTCQALSVDRWDVDNDIVGSNVVPPSGSGGSTKTEQKSGISVLLSNWVALKPPPRTSSYRNESGAFSSDYNNTINGDDEIYAASVSVVLKIPYETKSIAYFMVGNGLIVLRAPTFTSTTTSNLNTTSSVDNYNSTTTNIGRVGNIEIVKINILASMPSNAIIVRSPPNVLTATNASKIYVAVVIGLGGSLALFCFGVLVYYSHFVKHSVMKLVQGPLLATLAMTCFLQILFTFTYLPTKNMYCRLIGPLVIVPIHVGATILVARQWRVYATLGLASHIGRQEHLRRKKDDGDNDATDRPSHGIARMVMSKICNPESSFDFDRRFVQFLGFLAGLAMRFVPERSSRSSGSSTGGNLNRRKSTASAGQYGIRCAVTARETACLIIVLSLPQVVLEVFGAIFYKSKVVIDISGDYTVGRTDCSADGSWVTMVGISMICIQYISAVYLAWISRNLPSLFSETNRIFMAAGVNALLALITIPLLIFSDTPATSPDIKVFLNTVLSVGVAVTTLIFVVMPHVRHVMSGEKIVISNALGARYGTKSMGLGAANNLPNQYTLGATPTSRPSSRNNSSTPNATPNRSSFITMNASQAPIKIKKNSPLPRDLEERVLRVQEVLRSITDKTYHGVPLSLEDWHSFLEEEGSLHLLLDRVELHWEVDGSNGDDRTRMNNRGEQEQDASKADAVGEDIVVPD